jgi:hypothetical protein
LLVDEQVHSGAVGVAQGGGGLLLAASWAGWAFGYIGLLLAGIVVLSIM